MSPTPTALTIAGSDSSGGAGLQADLRAFAACGIHGASVVTLVTAQGTRGVRQVWPLDAVQVRSQLDAVFEDLSPRAVKSGALGTEAVVLTLADALRRIPSVPLVIDPVIRPTRGHTLLTAVGVAALCSELVPRAALITPNLAEAETLSGITIASRHDAFRAGDALCRKGARAVLIKGGHFDGPEATDLLFHDGTLREFSSPRLAVPPMHGLGCTLSALITARLCLGDTLTEAVRTAHDALHRALGHPRQVGPGLSVLGPLPPT